MNTNFVNIFKTFFFKWQKHSKTKMKVKPENIKWIPNIKKKIIVSQL